MKRTYTVMPTWTKQGWKYRLKVYLNQSYKLDDLVFETVQDAVHAYQLMYGRIG